MQSDQPEGGANHRGCLSSNTFFPWDQKANWLSRSGKTDVESELQRYVWPVEPVMPVCVSFRLTQYHNVSPRAIMFEVRNMLMNTPWSANITLVVFPCVILRGRRGPVASCAATAIGFAGCDFPCMHLTVLACDVGIVGIMERYASHFDAFRDV